MPTYIRPYTLASESARLLSSSLGVKRITGSKLLRPSSVVINWGGSDYIRSNVAWINNPSSVALAANKLKTFIKLTSVGIWVPPFTTNESYAKSWVTDDSFVYGRSLLCASKGKGITVLTQDTQWEACPLYTKAIPKAREYRVHVFRGNMLDYSQKKRRNESSTSPYIKNSDNGWVFCRQGVELPEEVRLAAIKSVNALQLDFAAVDVLYKNNKAYVLELNTAPGIEGTTLSNYVNAFRSLL